MDAGIAWPITGKIVDHPSPNRVVLSVTNPYLMNGQVLVVKVRDGAETEMDPDMEAETSDGEEPTNRNEKEYLIAVADSSSPEVILASNVAPDDGDLVGKSFTIYGREVPETISDWLPPDVAEAIHYLFEETSNVKAMDEHKEGPYGWRLELLSTPGLVLTAESTVQDLDAAWTEQRVWLQSVRERGLLLGVIGTANDYQIERNQQLAHSIMIMCSVYETLRSEKQLRLGMLTSGVAANEPYVNPWWYSVDRNTTTNDAVTMINYLLALAFRFKYRKHGDIVYEQVMSQTQVWSPGPDAPKCTHPDCKLPARYGIRKKKNGMGNRQVGMTDGTEALSLSQSQSQSHPHLNTDEDPNQTSGPASSNDAAVDDVTLFTAPDGTVFGRRWCLQHVPMDHSGEVSDLAFDVDGKILPKECKIMVFDTRSWRPKMSASNKPYTISEWMHEAINRTTNADMWSKWLQNYGSLHSTCENYLKRTADAAFPQFLPHKDYFSFANGVYNISENKFYEYGNPATPLPPVCSVNFVNQHLDPLWTRVPIDKLSVPGYKEILNSQNYTPDMVTWIDAFLGRLFFPIRERDTFEKLMVIKGQGATGKSTIAKAIAELIGAVNIGYIAQNCEEQWALANLYDKRLWVCLELKAGFRLATGIMQSMVSGESVVINEKHKTAFDITWNSQGFVVGNEVPMSWSSDVGGAIARRVLLFPFDVDPSVRNSNIAPDFMRNLAIFFVRIIRRYVWFVEDVRRQLQPAVGVQISKQLEDLMPIRLREASSEFKLRTSPLQRFIKESGQVEIAGADVLKQITYHLTHDAPRHGRGLSSTALGIDAAALTNLRKEMEEGKIVGFATGDDYDAERAESLLEEWNMSMDEFAQRYRTWNMTANNAEKGPRIQLNETYQPVCKDLRITVARLTQELTVNGHSIGKKYPFHWFGIKPIEVAPHHHPNPEFTM